MEALQLSDVVSVGHPCLAAIEEWGKYNRVVDFYLCFEADSTLPTELVDEPAKCQGGLCQVLDDLTIQYGVAGKHATQIAEFPDEWRGVLSIVKMGSWYS